MELSLTFINIKEREREIILYQAQEIDTRIARTCIEHSVRVMFCVIFAAEIFLLQKSLNIIRFLRNLQKIKNCD